MHIESLKITSLIMKYYHLLQMKQKNLMPKEFWDKNATMFSDNNGNSITIWTDDIECELDLRFNYAGFVQQAID